MRNEQDKIAPVVEQVDPEAVLLKEISRAMEMMKRVKKSNAGQDQSSAEPQSVYSTPEELALCQSTCC
jgi:hypothetical protein